ncbi:uncharacterized protein PFLUO_LOCUS5085 [Penicillium psychrofluorescens]|uniref:uncharacterized protein n=1 Tax=Penicillium riverlandense TaxID=1903569 RepID=UPI00254746E7|nr:uncharacterized protein N7474_000784 [Penicillium riverlandense]KAJ5832473.1 hypothetical protein N7474_000784 [Penicillium riverlandense]
MTVQGLRTVTSAQNGAGAFILQCKRLDLHYNLQGASSHGLRTFVQTLLPKFARQYPQIEFRVSPTPKKHPVVRGHYINGREKPICVRNMQPNEILKKVILLKEASGEKNRRQSKPVRSLNESVRGIWSPYHGDLRGV